MSRRLIGLGVLAFIFGIGAAVDSGIASAIPLSVTVATVIGVAAAGLGVYMIWTGRPETVSTESDPPETPRERTAIGADFERDLELLSGVGPEAIRRRRTVREDLEQTACGILATHAGMPEDHAAEALRQGTWTESPHAAAYFTGQYPEWAPLSLRMRDATPFQPGDSRKLEAAIAELESMIDESAR